MIPTPNVLLQELRQEDETLFLRSMQQSREFHYPFVVAPQTTKEFQQYWQKYQQENRRCFLALNQDKELMGVFNISEMVPGVFQSAYLAYFAAVSYAGQGLMSQALKLLLAKIFQELQLHRIEANIQPTNTSSIHLAARNGFRKEGFSPRYLKVNGIWCDHFRFALTYEDWLAYQ